MESLFDFKDHYSYLKKRLNDLPRGGKAKFSGFTRIQPAFLSQVLAKKYPLSLEQADLANSFLEHSVDESEFFILLVSRDRAGSESLKKHFTKQLDHIFKKRQEVVERLGRKIEISKETQGIYYSSWLYSAIHVATTIPHLRKVNQLRDYFKIGSDHLLKILQFLENHQLVTKQGDEFVPTQNWVRLDRSSPHITQLHSNWRHKAIQNFDHQKPRDLHYSGVFSMDEKTAKSVREVLLNTISKEVKKIEAAPEKELYVIGLDFFDLKND